MFIDPSDINITIFTKNKIFLYKIKYGIENDNFNLFTIHYY